MHIDVELTPHSLHDDRPECLLGRVEIMFENVHML